MSVVTLCVSGDTVTLCVSGDTVTLCVSGDTVTLCVSGDTVTLSVDRRVTTCGGTHSRPSSLRRTPSSPSHSAWRTDRRDTVSDTWWSCPVSVHTCAVRRTDGAVLTQQK